MAGSDLTVILDVRPGQETPLREAVLTINGDMRGNPILRFPDLEGVHFARLVLLEGGRRLLMNAIYDGTLDDYLDELLSQAPALEALLGHCDGFPGMDAPDALKGWLRARQVGGGIFFRAHSCTVPEVRRALALRDRIDALLSRPEVEAILSLLGDLPAPAPPAPPGRLAALGSSALRGASHLIITALRQPQLPFAAPPAVAMGREPSLTVNTPCWMTEREYAVQNEMTIMLPVHPRLRGYLKTLLAALAQSLRLSPPTDGTLAGVSTVHFGRWMTVDEGRYLLFVSNYDGSWESYVGEVGSDEVARGLDLIWGCCEGYPSSGSRDIQTFKKVIIDHQIRAEVFYSAFPDESIKNILNAIRTADTLKTLLSREEAGEFLRRL